MAMLQAMWTEQSSNSDGYSCGNEAAGLDIFAIQGAFDDPLVIPSRYPPHHPCANHFSTGESFACHPKGPQAATSASRSCRAFGSWCAALHAGR